ncbi:hypothetical protein AgCh_006278 [Apium graveolens]
MDLLRQNLDRHPNPQQPLVPQHTVSNSFQAFKSLKHLDFEGTTDPVVARAWLKELERSVEIMRVAEIQKTTFAAYLLKGEANYWWESKKNIDWNGVVTWARVFVLELTNYATLVQRTTIVEKGSERVREKREDIKKRFESQKGSSTGVNLSNKIGKGPASQVRRNPEAMRSGGTNVGQSGRQLRGSQSGQSRPPLPDCKICERKYRGECNMPMSIPDLGEIYPLGGSADRLGLVDPVTGECLPAAMLPYCGRTFLESHIRDLQADERALLICISICLREAVIGEACTFHRILASLYSGTVCIWNYQSQTMAKSFEVTELREVEENIGLRIMIVDDAPKKPKKTEKPTEAEKPKAPEKPKEAEKPKPPTEEANALFRKYKY